MTKSAYIAINPEGRIMPETARETEDQVWFAIRSTMRSPQTVTSARLIMEGWHVVPCRIREVRDAKDNR